MDGRARVARRRGAAGQARRADRAGVRGRGRRRALRARARRDRLGRRAPAGRSAPSRSRSLGIAAWAAATPGGDARRSRSRSRRSCAALRDRRILLAIWLVVLPALLFGTLGVLGPLRLDELGFGSVAIGAIWLIAGVLETGNNVVIGRIADRRGPLVPVRVGLIGTVDRDADPPVARQRLRARGRDRRRRASRSARSTRPAMTLLTHAAEHRGLDYGYAFALINLAWAPGQTAGSAVERRGRVGDVRRRAVPDARRSSRAYACRAVEIRQAPRSEPRRDRAARLPHGARGSGSRRSRSPRPTTAARCTPARPTRRERGRLVPLVGGAHPAPRCARAPTRSIPATASSPRAATSPRRSARPGSLWIGPPPDALRAGGDKLEARRIALEAGVPVVPGGAPDGARLPAARQGGRGRRRARDAHRALAGRAGRRGRGGARARRRRRSATTGCSSSATSSGRGTSRSSCSPTSTAPCSRSASASARCSAATRRCSRRRPRSRSTPSCARG